MSFCFRFAALEVSLPMGSPFPRIPAADNLSSARVLCVSGMTRGQSVLRGELQGAEPPRHSSTTVQLLSGSKSFTAVAVCVVVFPRSFWSSTPSWLIMKVITPELPYSDG